jgi:osmoprotectant transport system permease protein
MLHAQDLAQQVAQQAQSCLAANDWVCWEYVTTRSEELLEATRAHVTITVVSVVLGLAVALPLGLLAHRRPAAAKAILGVSSAIYTIPSLALFALLLPVTRLTATTVIVGLVLYSLTILVRAVLTGLRGVPDDVVESATGMGLSARGRLWKVELPLALPSLFAGLRVATVSTIALTTVGALIGHGGLGDLIYAGLRSLFKAEVLTASVLCVVLAVLADLLLVRIERWVTPWQRRARLAGQA